MKLPLPSMSRLQVELFNGDDGFVPSYLVAALEAEYAALELQLNHLHAIADEHTAAMKVVEEVRTQLESEHGWMLRGGVEDAFREFDAMDKA